MGYLLKNKFKFQIPACGRQAKQVPDSNTRMTKTFLIPEPNGILTKSYHPADQLSTL